MLRTYFEIAMTGSYRSVLKAGAATLEQCKQQWNKIVEKNIEDCGSVFDYINYIDTLEGYNHFLQEHNVITAQLIILHFQVDRDIIQSLNEKGYNIDTSGKLAYMKSLIAAIIRSKSLVSRLKMKANEMQVYNQAAENSKPATFDEVMVTLMMNLGQSVPDDITLARYNQFKKSIEAKHKQAAA